MSSTDAIRSTSILTPAAEIPSKTPYSAAMRVMNALHASLTAAIKARIRKSWNLFILPNIESKWGTGRELVIENSVLSSNHRSFVAYYTLQITNWESIILRTLTICTPRIDPRKGTDHNGFCEFEEFYGFKSMADYDSGRIVTAPKLSKDFTKFPEYFLKDFSSKTTLVILKLMFVNGMIFTEQELQAALIYLENDGFETVTVQLNDLLPNLEKLRRPEDPDDDIIRDDDM